MPIEETDYECPRCLTRYVLTLAVGDESAGDPPWARDFVCPHCGRRASDLQPGSFPGVLMAFRRGAS